MEAAGIVFRTLFIYIVIYFVIRIMGKREIGKLSVFDLVVSIMLAEIAVFVIEDHEKPIWEGILPMVVLGAAQIVFAYLALKSRKVRNLFDGKPSVIIDRGRLNREEMRKQRYNLDDLMQQLRENKITNVADVEFAVLEPTGKLTVTTKEQYGASNSAIRYEGLPVPLIMDGKVQDQGLEKIGQNRFWLKKELKTRGIQDPKEVFLCTIDHKGRWYIDKK